MQTIVEADISVTDLPPRPHTEQSSNRPKPGATGNSIAGGSLSGGGILKKSSKENRPMTTGRTHLKGTLAAVLTTVKLSGRARLLEQAGVFKTGTTSDANNKKVDGGGSEVPPLKPF